MREFLWVRPIVDIGERLKYIRETYDVSQEKMGRVLGVSKSSVSHYENNDYIIPMRKLCAISNYLDLSIDYIFDFTNLKRYDDMKREVNLKVVGRRLSEICHDQNFSNVALAKELNTTESNIRKYKMGQTLILTAFALQLSEKYSYSMDWIVGKSNHKYVQEKSKNKVGQL